MLSGDGSDSSRDRNPLCDVTNRTHKRGLSAIVENADLKLRDVKGKGSRVLEEGDERVSENLPREKQLVGNDGDHAGVEKIVSFLKGRGGDLDMSSMNGSGAQMAQEDLTTSSIAELHQSLEERGVPVVSLVEEDLVSGGSASEAPRDTNKDLGVGKLASNKFGSIEWSRLPSKPQDGLFKLERDKLPKDLDISNTCQGGNPLTGCSCTFCLKAAFIWTDLHYQDIKGRITALRKSQKEASSLVQKFGKGKEMEAFVSGRSKPSELESNLLNQWKSLFLHMDGVLAHEGSQLQSNYMAMKDLRMNCQIDLEAINGMPLNKD